MDFVTLGVCIAALSILVQGWGEQKMSERLFEFIVTGICVALIATSAIVGTWALFTMMSL